MRTIILLLLFSFFLPPTALFAVDWVRLNKMKNSEVAHLQAALALYRTNAAYEARGEDIHLIDPEEPECRNVSWEMLRHGSVSNPDVMKLWSASFLIDGAGEEDAQVKSLIRDWPPHSLIGLRACIELTPLSGWCAAKAKPANVEYSVSRNPVSIALDCAAIKYIDPFQRTSIFLSEESLS